MKKFLSEYLKVFAYTALGLVLVISSFYLLINYYHSNEVSRGVYITENDTNYVKYKNKIEEIKNNLNKFSKSKNENENYSKYESLYTRLMTCSKVLENEGTLANIERNKYYTDLEIFNLGTKFQTELLNICWAVQLSYMISPTSPSEIQQIGVFVKKDIDTLSEYVDYTLKEIENNGSYHYTTSDSRSMVRNNLNEYYMAITDSYNEFADIILQLSRYINGELIANGGNTND